MTENTLSDKALKQLTKRLVVNCVRTPLEPYHAGRSPVSKTGDNSDVMVTDADGHTVPLNKISRISDLEMKALMQTIVNRTYTFLSNLDDPELLEMMSQHDASIARWDTPKTDHRMLKRTYVRKLKELGAESDA